MNHTHTHGSTATRVIVSILAVVLILATGAGVFALLKIFRKEPVVQTPDHPGPLVAVRPLKVIDHTVTVTGFGAVRPRVNVQLIPQVSGSVVDLHPDMVDGGFFRAGETLITIDPRDYELAVQQARALVASSHVRLEREVAEAEVAKKEWLNLHPDQQPSSVLVLREPQIKQATAELQAAQARLERAELDLERTRISLPFDGRVVSKQVDRGQFITAGQPIAAVYGTDVMEIPVPLENKQLAWFRLPHPNGNPLPPVGPAQTPTVSEGLSQQTLPIHIGISEGPSKRTPKNNPNAASARVHLRFAGKDHRWTGRVVRTQANIDPDSRMVYVIVEVDEPFQDHNGLIALLPGMFVDVTITGKTLHNVIPVPTHAVHNTDEVWVIEDQRLRVKKVRIARQDERFAYVAEGLDNHADVVLTPLDIVTDNMKVRILYDKQAPTVSEAPSTEHPLTPESTP